MCWIRFQLLHHYAGLTRVGIKYGDGLGKTGIVDLSGARHCAALRRTMHISFDIRFLGLHRPSCHFCSRIKAMKFIVPYLQPLLLEVRLVFRLVCETGS